MLSDRKAGEGDFVPAFWLKMGLIVPYPRGAGDLGVLNGDGEEGGGGDGGNVAGGGGISSEASGMDKLLVNFSTGGAKNCRSSSVMPVGYQYIRICMQTFYELHTCHKQMFLMTYLLWYRGTELPVGVNSMSLVAFFQLHCTLLGIHTATWLKNT